jgi:hypothetical protein
MEYVQPAHIAALCPELRQFLDAELAAGNQIAETSAGWPKPHSIFVMLALPFKTTPPALPSGVTYLEVNDPHWWKAEYDHAPSGHLLGCRF